MIHIFNHKETREVFMPPGLTGADEGGTAQFVLEIDTKSLMRMLAYRAYNNETGEATLAGGRIRVRALSKEACK